MELWEGLTTFAFFPLTVFTSYAADRQLFGLFSGHRYSDKAPSSFSRPPSAFAGKSASAGSDPVTLNGDIELSLPGQTKALSDEERAYQTHRAQYIHIFKVRLLPCTVQSRVQTRGRSGIQDLRSKHPSAPLELLERMAEEEQLKTAPKSRAFYRINATRSLVGAGNILNKRIHEIQVEKDRILVRIKLLLLLTALGPLPT